MRGAMEAVEISPKEFKAAVEREFPFDEYSDATTFYWDFADMHYVATDLPTVRIQTWCGKREAEVWTSIERVDTGRTLGLDSLAALHGDDSYPPSMSGSWTAAGFQERIRLEGALIRRHLVASMDRIDVFESEGGDAEPDAVSLDDPLVHFVRRCTEYFDPLGEEFGLACEYDQMGSGLLYRSDPTSVRICLLETASEDEELDWSVVAEVIDSPGNLVPPLFFGGEELDLAEREGRFSLDYLERSLADAEKRARAELTRRRSDG